MGNYDRMQDMLQKLKANLEEEQIEKTSNIMNDVMGTIEDLNPKITSDSQGYKEGNKYIFKQFITYENSESLMKLVTSCASEQIGDLINYKDALYQKAGIIFVQGENPVEIMIYATRGINQDIYKRAVLDVLKDLALDYKSEFASAYKNILQNWTWDDCIELVLESIKQSRLEGLSQDVYKVFEIRYKFRERAAKVLIDIAADETFESITNFLVYNTGESTEEATMFRNIMYYMGKNSEKGSAHVYKIYTAGRTDNNKKNLLIVGIRNNMHSGIYNDMRQKLMDPETEKWLSNKIIHILNKTKGNEMSVKLAKECSRFAHIDSGKIDVAIDTTIDGLTKVVADKRAEFDYRRNCTIKLGELKGLDERNKAREFLKSFEDNLQRLNIVKASALVELGDKNEMLTLVKYLIGTNDEELIREANNQIRRLKGKNNEELNRSLLKPIASFLKNDEAKNIVRFERIIDLYHTGINNDEIGSVFLEKLETTAHKEIKTKLFNFFSRNYYNFSESLKNRIKSQIIIDTKNGVISKEAMLALKDITKGDTALPGSNK